MKARAERLWTEPRKFGRRGEFPLRDEPDESETARIVVDQTGAIVERELDVVVACGEFGVVEVLAAMGQAAAHPQMHDHRGAAAKLDD